MRNNFEVTLRWGDREVTYPLKAIYDQELLRAAMQFRNPKEVKSGLAASLASSLDEELTKDLLKTMVSKIMNGRES